MIHGVKIKPLKVIPDQRGFLMEMLRNDEEMFEQFGQVYITGVKRGVAKAWHYHKKQTDHFVCVSGIALVVLYDMRKNSPTFGEVNEFHLADPLGTFGEHTMVKIPIGVVHGFSCVHGDEARIINIPTQVYNDKQPDELRFAWNSPEIPYAWPAEVTRGG